MPRRDQRLVRTALIEQSSIRSTLSPPNENMQVMHQVEDTFDDSEDEFFAGRDQILLENGPSSKRRRLQEEGSDLPR